MDYNKKVRIHMPDGVEVEGVISKLEKHFIFIRIISPIPNKTITPQNIDGNIILSSDNRFVSVLNIFGANKWIAKYTIVNA